MFKTENPKIQYIYNKYNEIYPNRMNQFESILDWNTSIYLDEANIFNWQKKLWWCIDYKRLYQFFKSFDSVKDIHIYKWTLNWDKDSLKEIYKLWGIWYNVCTKDVKIMEKNIDISVLKSKNDPFLLKSFIRQSLLQKFTDTETSMLNSFLDNLNKNWILTIQDKKCNFDVEMWVEILLDLERWNCDNFLIWSADSDFQDVIEKIKKSCKSISVFWVSWLISKEINHSWIFIYDINKIKNFICWNKFIDNEFIYNAKESPETL